MCSVSHSEFPFTVTRLDFRPSSVYDSGNCAGSAIADDIPTQLADLTTLRAAHTSIFGNDHAGFIQWLIRRRVAS